MAFGWRNIFLDNFSPSFLGQKSKNFTHITFCPGKQSSDLSYLCKYNPSNSYFSKFLPGKNLNLTERIQIFMSRSDWRERQHIIKAADRKVIQGRIEETLDFRRLHKFKGC